MQKNKMDSLYTSWARKCTQISQGQDANWRRSSEVVHMLEHVQWAHAQSFLSQIVADLKAEQIQEFVQRIDSVGNPVQLNFNAGNTQIKAAPTSLRYLFHAAQIINMNPQHPIVEIGAGFGGLVLALDFVSRVKHVKIAKVVCVDLPEAQSLQRWVLSKFSLGFPVEFQTTVAEPCFLVSNYCLAEMGQDNRKRYIEKLVVPHTQAGFLLWNSSWSFQDLSNTFDMQVENEYPQTGKVNKVLRLLNRKA